MCGPDLRYSIVMATESYVQPVHKPYITLCQGHRLCSTYKYAYAGGKTTELHTLSSLFKEEEKQMFIVQKMELFSPRAGVDT